MGPWPKEFRSPREFTADWRKVLNETWPERPRDVPHRPRMNVSARLVWEDSGPEWLPGYTERWTQKFVRVQINDRRLSTGGVWLSPKDVRRREWTAR